MIVRAHCPNCDGEVGPRDDGSCPFCDADTDLNEQRYSVARAGLAASMVAATAGVTLEVPA